MTARRLLRVVSHLHGNKIDGVAAGLWRTICITADGNVYAFGENQIDQLGSGADQAMVTLFAVHCAACFNYYLAAHYHNPEKTWIGASMGNFKEQCLWNR